jgi:uncharacterized PurR-regulated membrane protein YhhQ (DUF165 family)
MSDTKLNNRKNVGLLFLAVAMLYVTAKVVCNPMFFRVSDMEILGVHMRFSTAAFIYPLIFILSDVMAYVENRGKAIFVVFIGVACDAFFSYALYSASLFPMAHGMAPTEVIHSNAIDVIGHLMPSLWYHGVIASLIAGTAEILIFSWLLKKIKNFALTTIISVAITLAVHNTIMDYQILKEYPDAIWRILSNYTLNMTVVIVYTLIIATILFIRNKRKGVA